MCDGADCDPVSLVSPMAPRVLLATALLLASALPAAAQSISLTLRDGRVTLVTQNATPAAILAEWARQGQVKVVDGERVPGVPLSLRLENVPEREALDIVLRGAAGYIAAPRAQQAAATQSRFDRVIVMAASPGAVSARAAARPAAAAPPPPVQSAPVVEEEPVVADAGGQQGAPMPQEAAPAGGEQPASSTNFDYANPQRYFAARQAEQQAAEAAAASAAQQTPQPGTTATPFGATRSTPGMAPTPPAQNGTNGTTSTTGAAPVNPYGLPAGTSPGSSPTPSTMEPDRSKYINPYAPTPPRP